MARKQSAAAETNQDLANGAQPKRGTKTAAIRELYARGVLTAKDIANEMSLLGLSVSMPVIYTTLKELKRDSRRRGGRKPMAAMTAGAANGAATKAPTAAAGMTAIDLQLLAQITKKAGGVDAVVGLLDVMKHFQ